MLVLGLILAALMGVVLGLLGGGGSILTVPILIYALGLEAKAAIATSLLVVAVTSLAGAAQHARAGNLCWRTGLLFSAVVMIGAYVGGRAAAYVSGTSLLLLFAGLMVVTGVAMLIRRAPTVRPATLRFGPVVIEGLVVGVVTGLVGAGGGFLVVPALVLLGGMDMRRAVGTSLLVIALKSFAGLAGHLAHVSIDLHLAAMVVGVAVLGSLVGTRLAQVVAPERLRKAFATFVLLMAGFMVAKELPPVAVEAVFVDRWPFWAGGAAIAGFVLFFLLAGGRVLGVSTGFQDACGLQRTWRIPFLAGIVAGGLIAALLSGGWSPTSGMGLFDVAITASLPAKAALFTAGGVLIGFGTRLAGGCTSGHGIVGMAQLAPSSLIATGAFMVSGFVVTNALFTLFGG